MRLVRIEFMVNEEIKNYEDLRERLAFYAEDEYREFIMKGIPSERPFLGVRVPRVRKITDEVPNELVDDFLKVGPLAFEEVLARGMLICRLSYEKFLRQFDSQISYIDDWCACDTFCADAVKKVRRARQLTEFFDEKVLELLDSETEEFAARAGLVILKCGYVDFDWLNVIFDVVERLRDREDYYVRMGIAWLLCECFTKFPEETLEYLAVSRLPKWTFNKAIAKICESYRVDERMKEVARGMRK